MNPSRLVILETKVDDLALGQEQLRTKVDDLALGQAQLRTTVDDLALGQAQLRTEVDDLRKTVTAQGADLRTEIAAQGADLRAEMATQGTELRAEIGDLRRHMGVLHKETLASIKALTPTIRGCFGDTASTTRNEPIIRS